MIAYDNSNVNLSGFIIAVLTSVGQLTGSYIAKFKKKGKRRNKYTSQQYIRQACLNQLITYV